MNKRLWAALAVAAIAAGCALYSEVSIEPLQVLPTAIDRGSDVQSMVKKADYLRAVEMAPTIDGRPRKSVADLAALGSAELAAARFEDARRHLRAAIDLNPFRTTYSEIAWDLSQLEYLNNNYESSLEWAQIAVDFGLAVKPWHLEYLTALRNIDSYRFPAAQRADLVMRIGRPDVPRVEARVNNKNVSAVVDSGAVLSILSEQLASSIPIRPLGKVQGTFYGLLGEPISVRFGIIDTFELGDMVIENVPVAIMPNDKMRFLVSDRKEFAIDCLLGANLLKEFRIEMDFTKSTITFTRLTVQDRAPVADQNLFFEGFRPMVRGTVNKKGWFLFVLDTGSEVTFLNETQLKNLPIQYYTPRVHVATLQGLGGAKKRGAKIENVSIGVDQWAGAFKTLPMYSADDHENAAGIVGENFLKNFHVTIDFGRMRVDLQRR